MATINDFKIVNQYSKKYFSFLNHSEEINETDKKRFGFYLLVLESITGNGNIDELLHCIIDTEFSRVLLGVKNNDYGIDAVYFNEEKKIIQLFNFKFKEKFSNQRGQNERNILDSSKFLWKIRNHDLSTENERSNFMIKQISERFDSDEIWSTELYLISNDNYGLEADNETLQNFKNEYDIKPISIVLDDIISFISNRPDDISAKFIVNSESVLTYEENSLSSSKSYLVKLSISNLIRITCNSVDLRQRTNMQDLKELQDVKLELGVLYDNVRGYLGETKFNKNILKTLNNEPSKFFMYNNGITITANDITMKAINGQKKFECSINGLQIVNGGQSIRTIYEFKDKNFDEEKLATAEVLVRIFKTEDDQELTNNIAEFTNSQNAISSVDLKSISNLQIQIEKYLETENIYYVRKSGKIEKETKEYDYRITMERLAQIVYSYQGYPDRATNQKSQLFDRYYDVIFQQDNLDLELYVKLIKLFYEVENEYLKTKYEAFNQKYFYVIFLCNLLEDRSIRELIEIVEEVLQGYRSDDNLSDARKLIQKGFKVSLQDRIKEDI